MGKKKALDGRKKMNPLGILKFKKKYNGQYNEKVFWMRLYFVLKTYFLFTVENKNNIQWASV